MRSGVSALLLTAALGWLFSELRVPSGWLIAALISAGGVAVLSGRQQIPARILLRPAQGCIGLLATAPLAEEALPTIARHLGIAAVCSGVTLIVCLLCTLILVRVAKTLSPATALLSTLAGGASGISTMAPDLGVDHRYVALSQYLRLVVVTLTLPVVLGAVVTRPVVPQITGGGVSVLTSASAAAVIAGAGYAALKLRWPAPFLLGPMLAGLPIASLASAAQDHPVLGVPPLINAAAYIVIGWQAGGAFTRDAIRQFVRLMPLTCTFIGITIGGCLGLAVLLSTWTRSSFPQAYLATTPGGIYAVLATAADSGAGPMVVTMQVFRLLVMYLVAVIGTKLLRTRTASKRAPTNLALPRTSSRVFAG